MLFIDGKSQMVDTILEDGLSPALIGAFTYEKSCPCSTIWNYDVTCVTVRC